jgi:hypothetical protein
MLCALLLASLAAAPKIEPIPKMEAPKINLDLPKVPKADGLSGTAREQQAEPKQTAGDLRSQAGMPGAGAPAKLASAVNAKDFVVATGGRKPVGRIDAFTVPGLPARISGFKTCLKLVSGSGAPVTVRAVLRSPSGEELLSSRAEVAFTSGEQMELVIEWDGFEARNAGDYHLVVFLDGAQAGDYLLPVQGR